MALSRADQRRIAKQDAARRQARRIADATLLQDAIARAIAPVDTAHLVNPKAPHVNPELVRGASVASPPRDVRVTQRGARSSAGAGTWANVTLRDAHRPAITLRPLNGRGYVTVSGSVTLANADTLRTPIPRGDGTAIIPNAVKVTHRDGTVEYRDARSYRRANGTTRNRTATTTATTATHVNDRTHRITAADLPADMSLASGDA